MLVGACRGGRDEAEASEAEVSGPDSRSESDADSDGSLERYSWEAAHARGPEFFYSWKAMFGNRVKYDLWEECGDGRLRPRHLTMPRNFEVDAARDPRRSYMVVRQALSREDVAAVREIGVKLPASQRCNDRDLDTVDHVAYRFEQQLRDNARDVYRKLLGLMVWADGYLWCALHAYRCVYPEVEYIRYRGHPGERKYAIEPHTDNRSVVTIVCLLSPPPAFKGGVLGFVGADKHGPKRFVEPLLGDAIIFRGEELMHWVTPVTAGHRQVLQIELSSV